MTIANLPGGSPNTAAFDCLHALQKDELIATNSIRSHKVYRFFFMRRRLVPSSGTSFSYL